VGIIVLLAIAVYTVIVPHGRFLTVSNLSNIGVSSSEILIMGTAMTYLLVAGGIDLSVGSNLVFSSVLAALTITHLAGTPAQVRNYDFPHQTIALIIGCVVALAAGTGVGLVNGWLISYQRMPAFIATLGMNGVTLGLAYVFTGGQNAPYVPSSIQSDFGDLTVGGVPIVLVTSLIIAGIGWVFLARTRFGIATYAIGASSQAARRAGINVRRHMLGLYAISGLCAGIAAIVDLAQFTSTSIDGHQSDMLLAITAVILGGTSLFGGWGGMGGTIIAVFFPSILYNGFIQLGLQPYWQGVVLGLVLIVAIWTDSFRRRRRTGGDEER